MCTAATQDNPPFRTHTEEKGEFEGSSDGERLSGPQSTIIHAFGLNIMTGPTNGATFSSLRFHLVYDRLGRVLLNVDTNDHLQWILVSEPFTGTAFHYVIRPFWS